MDMMWGNEGFIEKGVWEGNGWERSTKKAKNPYSRGEGPMTD